MNVLALGLCIQLADYWNANEELTEYLWVKYRDQEWQLTRRDDVLGSPIVVVAPDLGYLVRKLPDFVELDEERNGQLQIAHDTDSWLFRYVNTGIYARAVDPEDAAAMLAIELFKQGILQKASV